MKTSVFFCMFFLFGFNLFSQSGAERTHFVNPDPTRNVFFRINETRTERDLNPNILNNQFYVVYQIFDTADNLVFSTDQRSIDGHLGRGRELFITEDSVINISIPQFEWRGEVSPSYRQLRGLTSNIAPDGEYRLEIRVSYNVTAGNNRVTRNIARIMGNTIQHQFVLSYRIVVKGTPPEFGLAFIYVPYWGEAPARDIQYYFIYTTGDVAHEWRHEIICINGVVHYSGNYIREDRLPLIRFIPRDEDFVINVFARDEANNEAMRTLVLPAQTYINWAEHEQTQRKIAELIRQGIIDSETVARLLENFDSLTFELQAALIEIERLRVDIARRNDGLDITVPFSQPNRLSDIRLMTGEQYPYFDIPPITFSGNLTSAFSMEEFRDNLNNIKYVFNLIYPILDEFNYLHIHGFANPIHYGAIARVRAVEEENVLRPLSLRRAEYISRLLVLMGIPEERIKVYGRGGSRVWANPLDNEVNWRNRVVKFFVE
ncbi:MAG: hypothetical protein FWB78_00950 [Treponema sp.]|nr:hypothetical protein [Treponema sp.]